MTALKLRLAQTVRRLRSDAGFSQEGFAIRVKVHRTFMSSIERGKVNVSLETLERLAGGLNMQVWQLVKVAEVGGKPAYGRPADALDTSTEAKRKVAEDRER